MTPQNVAVLGTGKIGEALLSGMLRGGWSPARLLATARRPERAAELRRRYEVETVGNAEAAARAPTPSSSPPNRRTWPHCWTSSPRTSPRTAW